MKTEKAYLVNTHRYGFRPGEPAGIIDVVFIKPWGLKSRACYHVEYKDGKEDFVAISDASNYQIISESDVTKGRIPKVTQ